jgi:tRNA pseudouridine38-40 synthase
VHAIAQTAHFDADTRLSPHQIMFAANTKLPEDIRIKDATDAAPDFNARFDAKAKTYLYKFYVGKVESPLRRDTHGHINRTVDFEKMQSAAEKLVGTHDFKAFCSTGSPTSDTIRTVFQCTIHNGQRLPVQYGTHNCRDFG